MNKSREQSCSFDNEEEAADTLAPLCTCGQFTSTLDPSKEPKQGSSKKSPSWLESSFVHLMAPLSPTSKQQAHHCHSQHGFLEQHQHVQHLLEAAVTGGNVAICSDCIDRVAMALETDTQRLYSEVQSYQEVARATQQRHRALRSTLTTMDGTHDWQDAKRTYQSEIDMLRQEVAAREAELLHLTSLYKEQQLITKQLETVEAEAEDEQNALELDAVAFDDSMQLLSKTLTNIQAEVDQLSMVKLPQSLFDLQVDERGLRYPLINQLRLAYCPKGDVPFKEVQVAWSQATQLLLVLGSLLQYPSSDWKLVPLADCAKLIYRKDIFNLNPGEGRGLMAWNALLHQVVQHARQCTKTLDGKKQSQPRYPSSTNTNSIGDIDLTTLDSMDHVGWSRVIHRMASNLLWLSDRAAEFCALQVCSLAHGTA